MPRARRRRKPASRRSWVRIVLWVVVVAFAGVVVVGSIAEINAQSGGYRASVNTGFAKLATRVVEASNRTGDRLATLVNQAATLVNKPSLIGRQDNTTGASARAVLQQGLDQAVDDADQEARQASGLVPPAPTGGVGAGLTTVMDTRAAAVAAMRSAIDRQLGMSPLPIAGAPPTSTAVSTAPLLSIGEASRDLATVGRMLEGADRSYRRLAVVAARQHVAIRLPQSVWVTRPEDASPLGSTRLAQLPPALASPSAAALVPFHQVVITAAGLSPPAVASGGPGTIGTGCGTQAQSTVPGPTPTILAPTSTVTALVTVTNCGTVDESGITVSETLAPADPAGSALPPVDARGGRSHQVVSIRAGTSRALTLSPMRVAGGHLYTLDLSITVPASQKSNPDGTRGTSQQFLLKISP